ncbi:UNVERIFIED_CONTAM: hypothetical protein HDU68_011003 [Siphonaria sp. JEL0065]|nr:hypothetical protein HDU68_011003 [Siphonaria sp. JEL0065]
MSIQSQICFHRCQRLVPYTTGLQLQQKLVQQRLSNPSQPNMLLLLQHSPVYTAGRRLKGQASADEALRIKSSNFQVLGNLYLAGSNISLETGLDLFETSRGGQTTFHGPGQLIGYPILDLRTIYRRNEPAPSPNAKAPGTSVRGFVAGLEDAIMSTCSQFGISTKRTPHTGVWASDDRKVAALGVQVSRYITSHGFALNCNVDLTYFDAIVPCGLEDKQATSLTREVGILAKEESVQDVTVDLAIPALVKGFEEAFEVEMASLSTVDPALAQEIDEFLQFGKQETPFFNCI